MPHLPDFTRGSEIKNFFLFPRLCTTSWVINAYPDLWMSMRCTGHMKYDGMAVPASQRPTENLEICLDALS